MSRLSKIFPDKKAFVAYITAGDGGFARTLECLFALADGGVDIIEIGIPFSDPTADGPVIQQASQRAIAEGFSLKKLFDCIRAFRKHSDVPVVLFSYYNPLLQAGLENCLQEAKQAGVDGCLVVDLPFEESQAYQKACSKANLDPIFILSPSTPKARIEKISKPAKGFLYYACRKGTTGVRQGLPADFAEKISEIKSLTSLPVVGGFGIASKADVAQVISLADGFVVGSLFVDHIANGMSAAALTQLAQSLISH